MWIGMTTRQFCTESVRTWVHQFDTITGKDYSEIANLTISQQIFLWNNKISFSLVFHPRFTETSQYTCPIDLINCRLLSATKQNEKAKLFHMHIMIKKNLTAAESDLYLLSCHVSDKSSQYHIERKHVLHLGVGIHIPRNRYCHLNST